jgi:hypothetical protein
LRRQVQHFAKIHVTTVFEIMYIINIIVLLNNITVGKKTFLEEYEQMLKLFEVEYDDRYIFKPLE